jgi:hypothetical protein
MYTIINIVHADGKYFLSCVYPALQFGLPPAPDIWPAKFITVQRIAFSVIFLSQSDSNYNMQTGVYV